MRLTTSFDYAATSSSPSDGRTALCGVGEVLSEDDLHRYAPSIFADRAYHKRSQRYAFIPTIDVVRQLASEGFDPVFACEAKTRDEHRRGYTKHLLRFRRPDARNVPAVLGGVPEVVMIGSHDGSTKNQLLAGFFKFVCANASISGSEFGEVTVRHSGNARVDFIDGAFRIVETFDQIIENAVRLVDIRLKDETRLVYAQAALELKWWDAKKQQCNAPIKAEQLLIPRRHHDTGNDLWSCFNVVQENLIRGGVDGQRVNANGAVVPCRTRSIKGINQNVKLNRELWSLTQKIAELA